MTFQDAQKILDKLTYKDDATFNVRRQFEHDFVRLRVSVYRKGVVTINDTLLDHNYFKNLDEIRLIEEVKRLIYDLEKHETEQHLQYNGKPVK